MTLEEHDGGDPSDARARELAALVAIDRSRPRGFAPWRAARHVEELGSAIAVLETGIIDVAPDVLDAAARDVEAWLGAGLDMRSVLDSTYPANLRGVFDAPPYLFVEGEFDDAWARTAVAVVGTRNASDAGKARARKVARALVTAGYAVLSGLARGIDREAHAATIEAGGRTVAVMGTGIRKRYPAEHAELATQIVESGGALISQFEPDASGARYTFPMRNATMSGLALATVVVEAGETSGAKIQALAGLKHGSSVFLLRSLYESQAWARELVDVGKHGSRAVLLDDEQELLDALASTPSATEPLSFA